MKIDYTVDKSAKKKTIYVDFASKSPDTENAFRNPNGLTWTNNATYKNEIPVMKYIAEAERNLRQDLNGKITLKKAHNYYLKGVTLVREFEHKKDDKNTDDVDESKLYDPIREDSVYKMDIYSLGICSGEIATIESLGVSGKTLYDSIKDIMEKANYTHSIKYGRYRKDDVINFNKMSDTTNVKETFNEGFDGNIIGISNVKYSPTADLINNSITLYKSDVNENSDVGRYRYARKSNLKDVLRYGEQTHIESMGESIAYTEASQEALFNLDKYYKPDTTYTCTVVGLPVVNVGDYVATKTVNPILTNEYNVASRKIIMKVDDSPRIRTEYGLGDIDNTLKVKNNLAKQRRELVKAKLDLNEPAQYIDRMTDEFIEADEKVWVD